MDENPYQSPRIPTKHVPIPTEFPGESYWNRELSVTEHWIAGAIAIGILTVGAILGGYGLGF